ncbi:MULTISPECIES: hypothetical protein [Enterobacteriaceae]|uniref:hypothetical protein n=1 Tax=Enterobacteriaceae TaxID=543 RepID=UPI00114CE920|nr:MULTISPECIES: hypothetical protein [Enterobacteriaceae]MCW4845606.1 hypothetical protein [Enterobacter hormaechei subsp. xiangfangensis]
MDVIIEHAVRLLRDRDLSYLEENARQEVLSLYIDDKKKPSTEGRVVLALHAQAVGLDLQGEPAEFGKNRTLRFSGHP